MSEHCTPPIKWACIALPDVAEAAHNDAAEYDRQAADELAKILGGTQVQKRAPITAEQGFAKKLVDNPAEYDRYEKQRYGAVAKLQLE